MGNKEVSTLVLGLYAVGLTTLTVAYRNEILSVLKLPQMLLTFPFREQMLKQDCFVRLEDNMLTSIPRYNPSHEQYSECSKLYIPGLKYTAEGKLLAKFSRKQ